MRYTGRVDYAHERKTREHNTRFYRLCHWPIWIWVFFLAPGPLTFTLFARGFHLWNWLWLALVLAGTLTIVIPGFLRCCQPVPYILRFHADKLNPLYRRICYTFAWNAVLNFALLNLAGLAMAAATGTYYMKQIYTYAYGPLCAIILFLGIGGWLPRVGVSTKGEGTERRYFYGSVWAVAAAHTVLLILWRALPQNQTTILIKLIAFVSVLAFVGFLAWQGRLGRTRPILPGELIVSD